MFFQRGREQKQTVKVLDHGTFHTVKLSKLVGGTLMWQNISGTCEFLFTTNMTSHHNTQNQKYGIWFQDKWETDNAVVKPSRVWKTLNGRKVFELLGNPLMSYKNWIPDW